jgi:hypothetical protein
MKKLTVLSLVVMLVAVATAGCGTEPSPTPTLEAPTPTPAPSAPTPTSAPPTPTPTSPPSTPESPLSTPGSPLPTPTASTEEGGLAAPFELTSTAFEPGEPIPSQYTCDGDDPRARRASRSSAMTSTRRGGSGSTGCSTTCRPRRVDCRRMSRPRPICPTAAGTGRTAGSGWATAALAHPAARIGTCSGSTPWIRRSTWPLARVKSNCSRRWRDTSWLGRN